nr:immunoglobulin light chain junction region [Macaca mulatta]MOX54300.1 immunoglobulin light chain junction region [Macaca mulatta]MOX54733.1 immunoglobulin light chain junction region [Macaca mulatta]MOX54974.1 immunoglobulin light chain junction region [Macaca mulatta]MOX55432.1 immunoglobulin light chain junction region [Macaca mulatta]
CQQYSTLPYSF